MEGKGAKPANMAKKKQQRPQSAAEEPSPALKKKKKDGKALLGKAKEAGAGEVVGKPGPGAKEKKGEGPAAWKMGHDPVKGRIMVAARDLAAGEIILDEQPVVAGSWHAHRCIECHGTHAPQDCEAVRGAYPKEVADNMEKIEAALVEMDQVDELDAARRLIKALNLCRGSRNLIECTAPCTAHNLAACEATMAKIAKHAQAKHVIPPGVTVPEAARILSVLNTNSHELGEWGGSGFFILACLMEHSCAPNCTFNTHKTSLWVTVTEPVRKGGALSIDYNDSLFEPTSARCSHLREAYGFDCACLRCSTLPDRTRAFLCPGCSQLLCPLGVGKKPSDWKCLSCDRQLKKEERKRMVRIEESLIEEGPEDLEMVEEILSDPDTCFHPTHHIILDALMELAAEFSKDDDGVASGEADKIWVQVLDGAREVLRPNHPHLAILWDNLAQVRVARGDAKGAKKALLEAAEATRLSAGAGTPTTLVAQSLAEAPPKTTAEMAGSYENFRDRFAQMERQGIDGLAFFATTPKP